MAGYKLAVNGVPQQIQVEVSHAICARIFANEIHDRGVALPASGFLVACVEPEIAAVLGEGVLGNPTPTNRSEARVVNDRFHPAIELTDPRGLKVAPDMIPAAVALNVLNVGIVLGPDSIAPNQLDTTSMTMTLDRVLSRLPTMHSSILWTLSCGFCTTFRNAGCAPNRA